MADARHTLVLPFEKGLLSAPSKVKPFIMLNAQTLPEDAGLWRNGLVCEQGFRTHYLDLERQGCSVSPQIRTEASYAGALVLSGRARHVNEVNLTRAWNQVLEGAPVVVAGDKNAGIQSLRKWAGSRAEIAGSLSKYHAVVFWMMKTSASWPSPPQSTGDERYEVRPGMFSASGPDIGSQLLASHFDGRIRGRVADFGAGWGYLSERLLQRVEHVDSIDLFEADYASLAAARLNVVHPKANFHWIDMTSEAPRGPFDWIIMNPPFHAGRAADPQLGKTFIAAAARALPTGGRLLMVANRNLPYETLLTSLFRNVSVRAQEKGFKVFEALR